MLTAAALDVAVVVSLRGAAQGRLWLHAAPEGGGRLLEWYQARGLERVPRTTILPGPRIGTRHNDGRYFRLTEESAKTVMHSLDEYR